MALQINHELNPHALIPKLKRVFELSAQKIWSLDRSWPPDRGAPVFTVHGQYTSRGWTEWTQGFQYGLPLLQFDATGEEAFLELGRLKIIQYMAPHVSHIGVHDHGFNNFSTYGNLRRLMLEGKIPENARELDFYELALKLSGAVQAARWTAVGEHEGFIYSFNGPHSLFIDTLRSLRVLAVAHRLGHVLMGEKDRKISLLLRLLQHAEMTARYNVYYGTGRDAFDESGRTAHECIFNPNDGSFRCPNSQQGYSPFSTWTRGLAWGILGFAEQLEFLDTLPRDEWDRVERPASDGGAQSGHPQARTLGSASRERYSRATVRSKLFAAARAEAEFYLSHSCLDGIPVWDTGAPNLHRLGDYLSLPADPYNAWEPVDSSAAVIAAQGLIRLGNWMIDNGDGSNGIRYHQAGLTIADHLFDDPYLSGDARHQGLLLHSVYHRPNGWDFIAPGQKIPNGESSMWGDYHALELALMLLREARGERYLTFFSGAAA